MTLQRKLGQKKCMVWLSADETSLSNQSGRPPQYVSIRSSFWQAVAAAALGWAAGFAPSNEDLAFRAGVCQLDEPVSADHVHLLDDLAAQVGPEKNACFG